jgi:hypothetical protein
VTVLVHDPFDLRADEAIPGATAALDPALIQDWLDRESVADILRRSGRARLLEIRVIRHKPGRRCVLEYRLTLDRDDDAITLIGKIQSRKRPEVGYGLARALWVAGFNETSEDGIAVPEPIGVVPEARMWLQRRAHGTLATDLLDKPGAEALCGRVAEAAWKLHRAGVPSQRAHGMRDELGVLHVRLPEVARERPEWRKRIERVQVACDRLGASVAPPEPRGIHRDFYPDQVIADTDRLWLIDFDLYCIGDGAVDIGNFAGHVIEQALRLQGDPGALDGAVTALVERYLEYAGEQRRAAIAAYTNLTLARHIYLSTQHESRRHTTGALLDLCEERLARWI